MSTQKKSGVFRGLSGRHLNRNEVFRDENDDDKPLTRNRLPSHDYSESHDVAAMLLPDPIPENQDGYTEDGTKVPDQIPQSIWLQRQQSIRRDHLRNLLRKKKVMRRYLKSQLTQMKRSNSGDTGSGSDNFDAEDGDVPTSLLERKRPSAMSNEATRICFSDKVEDIFSEKELREVTEREKRMIDQHDSFVKKYHIDTVEFPIEVRIKSLSYTVPVDPSSTKIPTVYNSSNIYRVYKFFQRLWTGESLPKPGKKKVLDDINLLLRPGKMYLVLGPPGAGKSSLLKAISGRLHKGNGEKIDGRVCYNGKTLADKSKFHIENAVAYIDQLDRHAPRLTVDETFEFAFQCKTGGVQHWMSEEEAKKVLESGEATRFHVNLVLEALGLDEVKDTFVGDENVRGVSGGQRRRVTVGEMLMDRTPILCADEISTGLDAASTYEMIELINHFGRIQKMSRVIALLQPSPETVSLFDEVIVIAEGKILYAGPIDSVLDYFTALGYKPSEQMDVADFLQLVATPDAANLFEPPPELRQLRTSPYTATELAELFRQSKLAKKIKEASEAPSEYVWTSEEGSVHGGKVTYLSQWHAVQHKYANSFPRSAWLNLKRHLIIWKRDKRVLIANAIKNMIMGISVGGVFFQTDDVVSILGVTFQGMLFIMLGAMTVAPSLVDDRAIYRKHADANFYSAYPFVIGRTISQMPQILMDVSVFGTILYSMVGLVPTIENFFIYLSILFSFSLLMNQMLAVFAAVAPAKPTVQVMCACLLLFLILFGGFIVPPNVIPNYFIWIYWWNPFAWAYRALLVNEFQSGSYDDGDAILAQVGFVYGGDHKAFQKIWVMYWFIYMVPHFLFCVLLTALGLTYVRGSQKSNSIKTDSKGSTLNAVRSSKTRKSSLKSSTSNNIPSNGASNGTSNGASNVGDLFHDEGEDARVAIPFVPVTLTFEDICYDVTASKGGEQLRLLHNVNGIFQSGRMCALMGSSGAGKTTLMDVIALRKNNGTVSGEVRLNGYLQDTISFRRTSGYVEQFDIQTPELTVREALLFSARLRLDANQVKTDEEKVLFVDQVLGTLELSKFADCLVGSEEEGGLSFEQRKRVSIAVELAASPSIIFLDEPTSGLDSRSALLVVKLLRRIADEGRTICATIHQPSSAVFEMFDDLLLLRQGGSAVFFGELGPNSRNLVSYFEACGVRAIDLGENPANWVLSAISSEECTMDLAESYMNSDQFSSLKAQIAAHKNDPDPEAKLSFDSQFACPSRIRQNLVNRRLQIIYWRSPTYNLSRMAVSLVIACVLGSVFIPGRGNSTFSEQELRAKLAVIFLSFIITGILGIVSVLPVMLRVRDMYYRHRAAGMIDSTSLAWALGNSEKWFLILSSFTFVAAFIGVSGFDVDHISEVVAFWGFFTFNIAIYSYFGQAFVCLVNSMATAQILASVFIGLNNFFSGLIVRPQFLRGFFNVPYWITPGHFVFEGMVVSIFTADLRTVVAEHGSDFFYDLGCEVDEDSECAGTVSQFVYSFFGGRFSSDNIRQDALILGAYLVLARVLTFFALTYMNFAAT